MSENATPLEGYLPFNDNSLRELSERNADHWHDLRDHLKDTRERLGLSVDDVASRMSIPPETITEFEAYWSNPSIDRLRTWAYALGLEINYTVTARLDPKDIGPQHD